jgi:uncharacterized membrane protein YfcA
LLTTTIAIVLLGAVAAGFVQGLSGFAFSLVALSIWAWAIEPTLAAPLAVFGSLIGQLATWPLTRSGFEFKRLLPFLVGGLLGVPLGVTALHHIDPTGFRLVLGSFLIVYCPIAFFMDPTRQFQRGGGAADGVVGFIGGAMGGMGGMAGSVPALWVTVRGWTKETQRGTMQAFNIAMHTTTLTSYVIAGKIITHETLGWFAMIAPALVIPALGGALMFRRLDALAFRRLVLALLFVSGLALVGGSIGHH